MCVAEPSTSHPPRCKTRHRLQTVARLVSFMKLPSPCGRKRYESSCRTATRGFWCVLVGTDDVRRSTDPRRGYVRARRTIERSKADFRRRSRQNGTRSVTATGVIG